MERHVLKEMITSKVSRGGGCMTALTLAREVGLKKSPHFIGVLEEMVNDNDLVVQWARGSNRHQTRFFSLPSQVVEMFEGYNA